MARSVFGAEAEEGDDEAVTSYRDDVQAAQLRLEQLESAHALRWARDKAERRKLLEDERFDLLLPRADRRRRLAAFLRVLVVAAALPFMTLGHRAIPVPLWLAIGGGACAVVVAHFIIYGADARRRRARIAEIDQAVSKLATPASPVEADLEHIHLRIAALEAAASASDGEELANPRELGSRGPR